MSGYPAEAFRVDGDPTAIRASALGWTEFSEQAGAAASQIRGLDTSLFIGPEADQYRDGLSAKLPPHLQATSEAYGGVASALNIFAASLDDVLERMNPLGIRAPGLWGDLTAAERAVESAKSTDLVHQQRRALEQAQLVPGEALPVDYYQPATGTAAAALTAAQHAWNQALTTAQGLKADLAAAIDVCVKAINDQAHTRFTPNPSGWSGFVAGVKGFVKDHVAALSKLSSVLKTVSMVAGFLALVPGLDIIAAPIALAAGGAALAIDAATMWATGTWDPKTLALDAVAIIPAGKILSGAGKLAGSALEGTELASKVSRATSRVSDAVANGTQTVRAAAAGVKAYGKSLAEDVAKVKPARITTPNGISYPTLTGTAPSQMFTSANEAARAASSWSKTSGILRAAARRKGNFGLGQATPEEAEEAGRAWVGDDAALASDGKSLRSQDGLRQYRPPTFKPRLDTVQANLESRYRPRGEWQNNGHLDIRGPN